MGTVMAAITSDYGVAELDAVHDLLLGLDSEPLRLADDRDLVRFTVAAEAVGRALAGLQLAAAAEIADRSRPLLGTDGLSARHGHVRPGAFLEQILRISGAEAGRRIQLGSALCRTSSMTGTILEPRFAALSGEVSAGEVGPEAAAIIVRALDDARRVADPHDLEVAEAGLVDHARTHPVQLVADLAAVIRDRLDPDGVLPREAETRARRGFRFGRERNGIVPFSGGAAPVMAALLKSAFDEANAPSATPRFLSEDDRRDGTQTTVAADGTETLTLRDVRTRDQRQHDVLAGLLTAGIRNTGFEAGQIRSTADVTVHVALADLEAGVGVGWIDGIREPVSVSTVERLACDATFRRIVLGNDGEVIALGTTRYPFSSAQRKAIIARDGDTCLLCDTPASWADAHHVQEYYTHGATGRTDVDNGVLLCGAHHDLIHHSEWQLRMVGGIPHLMAPFMIDSEQRWKRVGRPRVRLANTG